MIKVTNKLSKQGADIRYNVFIIEQGFNVEIDELDQSCLHVVYYLNDIAVAACRFYKEDELGTYHLGRFAVSKEYRNKHVGFDMLNEVIQYIKSIGGNKVVLSAQLDAVGFYLKCGFVVTSDVYYEQHCPHKDMEFFIK